MSALETYDVAVVGAGVFGAWTAHRLRRAGLSVALVDAYGAANSRASSGGESRIIRMGYGADEVYTRWAVRSLALWQDFFREIGEERLFRRTGVLWMARDEDAYTLQTVETLREVGVSFEKLSRGEMESRYPQVDFGEVTWAVYEPDSGALLARRAVREVVREAVRGGVRLLTGAALPPPEGRGGVGRLDSVHTRGGQSIAAESFVFACGPWLPKLFPALLADRIHPTRQEVFFFGVPPGDDRFAPPLMPVWVDFHELVYAVPDLEGRGFKLAIDRHGPPFDPDTGERVVTPEGLGEARRHLARRTPALRDAPLLETRVCQYENTSNGDFLIDRHPAFSNVWLVGGGSGHGFKHGPALGEYVAARVTGASVEVEPRFSLATKDKVQQRSVF